MAVMKRKAVTKFAKKVGAVAAGKNDEMIEDGSAAEGSESATAAEQENEEEEHEEENQSDERAKELKAMPVDQLKELIDSLGLERGKKTEMIDTVLEHEEHTRKMEQEKAENMRKVMVEKTKELSGLAAHTIKEQCIASGIIGNLSKQERIERLLQHWQEHDGVNKALADINCGKREVELNEMECDEVRELCEEAGVDTLVKEILVDRIIRKEISLGKFNAPIVAKKEDNKRTPETEKKSDLVATLLANEAARAQRKAEEEKQKEREAAMAKKKDVLKALTVTEIKQKLAKLGMATSGTKDELIESLFNKELVEDSLSARKAELKALGKDGLKELLASKGLEGGSITDMIDTLFKHEAKCEQDVKDYEQKVMEQLKIKKTELEKNTGNALKEMCVTRGLAAGVSHEDRVQRLLRDFKEQGDIDRAISMARQKTRREALEAMDKPALQQLCEDIGVDVFVKAILIERLLHYEFEAGHFAADKDKAEATQPATKKQRRK